MTRPRSEDDEAWIVPAVPVPDLADCLDSFYDNPGSLPQPLPALTGSHPDAILLELEDPPVDVRGHSLAELLRPAYPAMSDAARQRITGLNPSSTPVQASAGLRNSTSMPQVAPS